MRETCARVLAAALMTGAIGFVLAMPALVGAPRDVGRPLTTPPSFLQRSVDVVASAPSRPARAGRLEQTHRNRSAARGAVVEVETVGPVLATVRQPEKAKPAKPPRTTAPKPAPQPPTRELASSTAASQPAAAQPPAISDNDSDGKGKGKGKGRGKKTHKETGKGDADQPATPTAPPPPPPAAPASLPVEEAPEPDDDKGRGHGNGKSHDKGREE